MCQLKYHGGGLVSQKPYQGPSLHSVVRKTRYDGVRGSEIHFIN